MPILLISILILSVGCQTSKTVDDEVTEEMVVVGYSESHREEIFGDLNREEINEILDKVSEEIAQDEEYRKNIDSIIEKVFRENGIEDEDKINTAKTKIGISK